MTSEPKSPPPAGVRRIWLRRRWRLEQLALRLTPVSLSEEQKRGEPFTSDVRKLRLIKGGRP